MSVDALAALHVANAVQRLSNKLRRDPAAWDALVDKVPPEGRADYLVAMAAIEEELRKKIA